MKYALFLLALIFLPCITVTVSLPQAVQPEPTPTIEVWIPTATPMPTSTPVVVYATNISASSVFVRSCPDRSCPIVGRVLSGQAVRVVSIGDWLEVVLSDRTGYTSAQFYEIGE